MIMNSRLICLDDMTFPLRIALCPTNVVRNEHCAWQLYQSLSNWTLWYAACIPYVISSLTNRLCHLCVGAINALKDRIIMEWKNSGFQQRNNTSHHTTPLYPGGCLLSLCQSAVWLICLFNVYLYIILSRRQLDHHIHRKDSFSWNYHLVTRWNGVTKPCGLGWGKTPFDYVIRVH